jgi:hypothetical protein
MMRAMWSTSAEADTMLLGRVTYESFTLFCSVGLAGTEVFLLDRLAATAAAVVGD